MSNLLLVGFHEMMRRQSTSQGEMLEAWRSEATQQFLKRTMLYEARSPTSKLMKNITAG